MSVNNLLQTLSRPEQVELPFSLPDGEGVYVRRLTLDQLNRIPKLLSQDGEQELFLVELFMCYEDGTPVVVKPSDRKYLAQLPAEVVGAVVKAGMKANASFFADAEEAQEAAGKDLTKGARSSLRSAKKSSTVRKRKPKRG